MSNTKNTAKPISAICIITACILPNGVSVLTTPCEDYAAMEALPAAVEYGGKIHGCTGYNSDTRIAYYRDDRGVALAYTSVTSGRLEGNR